MNAKHLFDSRLFFSTFRIIMGLWLTEGISAAREGPPLSDVDRIAEPSAFVGVVEDSGARLQAQMLQVHVIQVLKGRALPSALSVVVPDYVLVPVTETERIFFGTFQDGVFQVSDQAFIRPATEKSYFAALLSGNLPEALVNVVAKKTTRKDIKHRALIFLNGGTLPWPWKGRSRLQKGPVDGIAVMRSSACEPLAEIALDEPDSETALLALAVYASLCRYEREGDLQLLELLWDRHAHREGFRLLAIVWHYWPGSAGRFVENRCGRLSGYGSRAAQQILEHTTLPLSNVECFLLCQMLEDDLQVEPPEMSQWQGRTAASDLSPCAPGTVGGFSRVLLYTETGTWLPFDTEKSLAWLKGRELVHPPVAGFGVECPVSVSWQLFDEPGKLKIHVKNTVAVDLVVAPPAALSLSLDFHLYARISNYEDSSSSTILEPGTERTFVAVVPGADEELVSDLTAGQNSVESTMCIYFPKPKGIADEPLWFGFCRAGKRHK